MNITYLATNARAQIVNMEMFALEGHTLALNHGTSTAVGEGESCRVPRRALIPARLAVLGKLPMCPIIANSRLQFLLSSSSSSRHTRVYLLCVLSVPTIAIHV